MIVFIPAAGLGTRLKPLTDHKPKALVEYQGKPLLVHLFERLQAQGFGHFVLNLHHFAPMLRDFAADYARRNRIRVDFSDESGRLLDTGGALTHAFSSGLFAESDTILVHNVDIFSDLDLMRFCSDFRSLQSEALPARSSQSEALPARSSQSEALPARSSQSEALPARALQSEALPARSSQSEALPARSSQSETLPARALLSVRRRPSSRYLYADAQGRLTSWQNTKTGEIKGKAIPSRAQPYAFSGIHLLHRDLIATWAQVYGTDAPFSVIDAYLETEGVYLQEQQGGFWKDMGKIDDFNL